jgi:hypothetical protein
MIGVVTRLHVLAHPLVVVESYGLKVLVRALLAPRTETFLDVVTRCAEEDAHRDLAALDLARTVRRFIAFERRARDLYAGLARTLAATPAAARFFTVLAAHEEGHALVLARVLREVRRGHLWKQSRDLHLSSVEAFEARFARWEAEARRGVDLARALALVEELEGSELNVVFESLNGCVDMRSRARFERFFVLTDRHLAYCREQVARLRSRVAPAAAG